MGDVKSAHSSHLRESSDGPTIAFPAGATEAERVAFNQPLAVGRWEVFALLQAAHGRFAGHQRAVFGE